MKILAFAASYRATSLNKQLLNRALVFARETGVEIDHADFREFDMPMFDGDWHEQHGLVPGALELKRRVEEADGLLIASPEYNFSVPGHIKNALDWISRARPMPTQGKVGMIMSASTSLVGGIRGLWQLRIPLEGMGVLLMPDMFALSQAQKAFAEDGSIADPALDARLKANVEKFVKTLSQLTAVQTA